MAGYPAGGKNGRANHHQQKNPNEKSKNFARVFFTLLTLSDDHGILYFR
jgi:hypothetical protein